MYACCDCTRILLDGHVSYCTRLIKILVLFSLHKISRAIIYKLHVCFAGPEAKPVCFPDISPTDFNIGKQVTLCACVIIGPSF